LLTKITEDCREVIRRNQPGTESRKKVPGDGDVGALPRDVDEPVVVVGKGASVDPDVGGVGLDLDAVDVVAAAALELEVADDDVVAVLELEALAGELHALPAAVDGLVGGDPEVGLEVDCAGDLEYDPQRLRRAARLPERPVPVVCKIGRLKL
jgi:hypothetical protein